MQKGDVVLKNHTSECLFWKLAIVDDLLKGSDGQIRAAVVTSAGVRPVGRHLLLRRSIKHLYPYYPIKVNSGNLSNNPSTEQQEDTVEPVSTDSTQRPQ